MFYAELCGTTRNFFLFFERGGSLCFAHATEHSGTPREWYRTRSGPSSRVADTRKVSHLFMWPSSRVADTREVSHLFMGLSSRVADTREVSLLFMGLSSRVAGFQHRQVSCHTYLFVCKVRRSAKFRGLSEAKASVKFQKKKKFRVVPTSSAQNIKCASI